MLKLSRMTDYAVVVLVRLSEASGIQTSGGIAASTGVPEPTVAKVLKIMNTAGLVLSHRGARGGYRLAKPLATISIAEVIIAIDGPIALTACVEHSSAVCDASSLCPVKGRWDTVNMAIQEALSAISLADMRPTCSFPLPAHHVPQTDADGASTASELTTALVE